MFTGLIQSTARITLWRPARHGGKVCLHPGKKLGGVKIGESIAVNGCCLTVVANRRDGIEFDISDESLRMTTWGRLQEKDVVNLERSLRPTDLMGGHLVLGHVDAVGQIKKIIRHKGSVEFQIGYPKKFASLLIEKGCVAVDGISLTVCDLSTAQFSVYVIPHTLRMTNLMHKKEDNDVNLEFDVVGKYILEWKKS